jgi:hypothetical protein
MPGHSNSSRSPSASKRRAIAEALAQQILGEIDGQKLPARFIEGYAQQYGRLELVVHAERNRELQSILEREILLAMLARIAATAHAQSSSRTRDASTLALGNPKQLLSSVLNAIARRRCWTAGDLVEITGELNLYREIIAKSVAPSVRAPKTSGYFSKFQTTSASSPFVDRCAFILDPSMMENARVASAKFLREIETLADRLLEESIRATRKET